MKAVRLVLSIFFIIGLGLCAGGVLAARHTQRFIQAAATSQGVVVENLRSFSVARRHSAWIYYPRIRFRTANRQEIDFVSKLGTSPPAYRTNEIVTVLYDPFQPHNAAVRGFMSLWFSTTVLLGLGLAFMAPGIGFGIYGVRSARKAAWLEQNGRRIQAEVIRVELNTNLRVNGANPYRIVCQWLDPANRQVHLFKSANIWFNPTEFIPGKTLEVLVDPNDPHRYLVDTAFLPKLV